MAVTAPLSTWSLPLARVEVQCAQQGLLDQFALGGDHDYHMNLARYNGEASKHNYILDVHDGPKLMVRLKLHDLLSRPDDTVSLEEHTKRINISVRAEHFPTHCLVVLDFTNDRNFNLFAALLQKYGFKLKAQASERLSFITPLPGRTPSGASQSDRSSLFQGSWSPSIHDGQLRNDQLVPYMPHLNPYNVYSRKPVADPYRPRQSSPLRRDVSALTNQSFPATNSFDGAVSQHVADPSTALIRAASFNSYSQSQRTQQTDLSLGLDLPSQPHDSLLSNLEDAADTSQSSPELQSNSTEMADAKATFAKMLPQQRILPFEDVSRKRSVASFASDSESGRTPDRQSAKRRKPSPKSPPAQEALGNNSTKALANEIVKKPRPRPSTPKSLPKQGGKTPATPRRRLQKPPPESEAHVSAAGLKEKKRKPPSRATLAQADGTPLTSTTRSKTAKILVLTPKVPQPSTIFGTPDPKPQVSKSTLVKIPKAGSRAIEKGIRQLENSPFKHPVTNSHAKKPPRRKAPSPPVRKAIKENGGYKEKDEAQQEPRDPPSSAVILRPVSDRLSSLRSATRRIPPKSITANEEKPRTNRRVATPNGRKQMSKSTKKAAQSGPKTVTETVTSELSPQTVVPPPREANIVSERQMGSLALMSLKSRKRETATKIVTDTHSSKHLPVSTSNEIVLSKRIPDFALPRPKPILVTESMLTELHRIENRILDQYEEDMQRCLAKQNLMQYYGHHLVKSRSEFWSRNLATEDGPMSGVLL